MIVSAESKYEWPSMDVEVEIKIPNKFVSCCSSGLRERVCSYSNNNSANDHSLWLVNEVDDLFECCVFNVNKVL